MTEEQLKAQEAYRAHVRQYAPLARSQWNDRVRLFMGGAKQPVRESPGDPGQKIRQLGAELILEEALETIESLGFRVIPKVGGGYELIALGGKDAFDLVETVDGCLDTIYVCHWTLNAVGVPDLLPMLEVCDSNDRKLGPGCAFSESGKVQKPRDWVGPDIEGAIAAQKRQKEGAK